MATMTFTATVRFRWWVMPYVNTLIFFCKLFGCEPNHDKVSKILERGIVVRVDR